MVLKVDREQRRISLSTKAIEPAPGDMVYRPQRVYNKADEMAEAYRNNHQIKDKGLKVSAAPTSAGFMCPIPVSVSCCRDSSSKA
eukprot:350885-Chlamydomonas_euryale.AAC.1